MKYGSVCSGIESASVAWEPLGMSPVWFSEIEQFPCAVLEHHWPDVPNLGDMTNLPELMRMGLIEAPSVLVGGTPCQAFSVAGKRESLNDNRGQLTLTYVDLLNAIDEQRKDDECVAVWENVPGVLNTKDNAFGCFLGELSGSECELQPSGKRWSNAGCVFGPKRSIAWRVIDAQYFGVAQRRRRVFLVASARKGFDPTKILFESEGLRRDIAPSRETQSHVAALTANDVGTCGADDNQAQAGHLVANPLPSGAARCINATATATGRLDPNEQTFVVATLDASYGRLQGCSGQDLNHGHSHLTVVHGTQDPCVSDSVAFALGRNNGAENAIHSVTLRGRGCEMGEEELVNTLRASADAVRRLTPIECELLQGFPDNHTLLPYGVRQKLDTEMRQYYERHMGRTLTDDEQRELCADGPRYKAIGNSKAVPCIEWIGVRLIAHLMGLL